MDEELLINGVDNEMDVEDVMEAFMNREIDDDENLSDDLVEVEEEVEDDEESDTEEDDVEDEDEEDSEDPEDSDEDEEDEDADDEEEEQEEAPIADDEAEVVFTVDGEEKRVSVGDLKRLAGQEASLTQKSQNLAEQRRTIEAQGLQIAHILESQHKAALEKVKQFQDVDLFKASREMEPEEFDALREAKKAAESNLEAIERNANEFLINSRNTRTQMLQAQAKDAIQELQKNVEGWSDELYDKVRSYAVGQGMDVTVVNELVDPSAIAMFVKAMKYDEAQTKKKTVKKKITKTPKKAAGKSDKTSSSKSSNTKRLKEQAQFTGDIDDVAELFMASMKE